ncbi:bifunctional diguanylate cyclase/phosphodiesterase [Sulfurovum sp. zt1-1]|uniref:Bifunctional diguanylate cyclase/phosphodiesterase n=1 Tax=Sulfurovum zhangzhouensis TaxID=3019067 RepID=A0ABT7QWS1_9BACT|nr:bifunctional diguanylate cyclase/phosphodiesterase [Sulfurovum zhangzhouensis]MDM5271286.1 bifunctional diguanylate cyclase/phosphodiesterase [Sulfurovum zhangzhouensis]
MNIDELKTIIIETLMNLDPIFLVSIIIVLLVSFYLFNKRLNKKLPDAADQSRKLLKKVFDTTDESVLVLSSNYQVVYANDLIIKLLGLKPDDTYKKIYQSIKVRIKKKWMTLDELIESELKGSKNNSYEQTKTQLCVEDKDTLPINIHIIQNFQMDNKWKYIVSIQDLRYEEEQKALEYLHHVTKLPNQTQALEDFNLLFAKTHLINGKLVFAVLEIDNFFKLRSILGYEQSTKIMVKLANYLTSASDKLAYKVYHMFPNSFLIVMTDVADPQIALNFVQEVQAELKKFYKMQDIRMHLTASVGISIYPDSGNTRNLLDNAYKALSEAQSHGHGQVHIFMPKKARFVFDELTLYNEMHLALENNEFELYYQPIMNANTQEIVSAEALIRWIHPVHGLIPPDAFIPIMEKTGFIIEVGKYILNEVLKQQKRWEMFRFKQIPVSINVSMIEVETGNFFNHVEKKLAETHVDPELITFEVTEGKAMESEKSTLNEFHKLHKLGVKISLDDFGTGYTSFSYIKKFPADVLKIDRSFMEHILVKKEDQRIVQGIIELAHNLEMKVVVEGIENLQVVELMASYGCDYLQGYYFSKPLPSFEFQKFLR